MKEKILLLHGALGTKMQIKDLQILLSDRFEVYSLDFEGHGSVLSTSKFSMAIFSLNVIDFLNKNNIERIHIFGYSMGGYVALETAKQFPDRVDKIVSLATKFNWDEASTLREVKMLDPEKIEEKVPRFAEKLKIDHHVQDWKEMVRKTADMMLDLSNGSALSEADFTQIKHEVFIGIGTMDKMVSIEESEKVASLLPNGHLIEISDFVHPIEKNDPEAIAHYIKGSIHESK